MAKVTVVGAGNVGATCANVLAHKDIVKEVVLLDIKGDVAKGKALDTWQQAPIDYYSTSVIALFSNAILFKNLSLVQNQLLNRLAIEAIIRLFDPP